MKKRYITPLLIVLALAVWLGTSLYLTGIAGRYDNAVISNPYFFWFYAPIVLLARAIIKNETPKAQKEPRWGVVFFFLLFTALAFFAVLEASVLLYQLYVWWLAFLCAGCLTVWLYERSPYRRPRKPKAARSPIQNAAVVVLLVYLSILAVTVLYLAVLRPVTVDKITPIGEAECGKYIGRITGNRAQNPLGLYVFAEDGGQLYYYDVLTGAPVDY